MSTQIAQVSATYRDYSPEFKAAAIAAYEANGNKLLATAEQLGIPFQTLDYWVKQSPNSEFRKAKVEELADECEIIARKIGRITQLKLDNEEDAAKVNTLPALSTAFGTYLDKMLLLRGQPTSITATVDHSKDLQVAVAAIVTSEKISEYEAAVRLAEQLQDVPELASQLREWAEGELRGREAMPPVVAGGNS